MIIAFFTGASVNWYQQTFGPQNYGKNNVMYKLSPKNVGLFPSPKVEGNVGFNGS